MNSKPTLLLIDGFNYFYRNYQTNLTVNENGEPIGGFTGFFNSLRSTISMFNPQQVVVVFDGLDAGKRRRSIKPDYKGKRARKERSTTVILGDDYSEKVSNEDSQLKLIFEYLTQLPVSTLSIKYYEADDIISYLAVKNKEEYNVIIASSDEDYLQLVTQNICIWSPTKKVLIDKIKLEEFYKVKAKNFIYLKVVRGDKSDNISGVDGVRDKTLIKNLPILLEQELEDIGSFLNEIEKLEGKNKTIAKLKANKNEILDNFNLIDLSSPHLSLIAYQQLEEQIKLQQTKVFNRMQSKIWASKNNLNFYYKDYDSWIKPFIPLIHFESKLKY